MPVGDVNFVTIPGDLNWLTYKTPKYIDRENGQVRYATKDIDLKNDKMNEKSQKTYFDFCYVVDKISSDKTNVNDFVIADRELPGSLWKTVYDWATADARGSQKYDFGYVENTVPDSTSTAYERSYWVSPKDECAIELYMFGTRGWKENQRSGFSPWFGAKYTGTSSAKYNESDYRFDNRGDENHPVVHVNLYDAMLFCNALTEWYNSTQGGNLTLAYGENRTYTDIKNNLENYIYDSVNKTGFRLPTYSEWFAAATIVPTVDNFTEAQGVGGISLSDYTGETQSNYGTRTIGGKTAQNSDAYGMKYDSTGTNSNYLRLSRYWPPLYDMAIPYKYLPAGNLGYASLTYQDTSFPFLQKLSATFSGDNEDYHYFGIDNGYKLAWYTKDSSVSPGKAGTKPVANNTSAETITDLNSGEVYDPTKFIPNSIGLWDMSGNASEWVISPQESKTSYNVWLIGGDHQGSEHMSYLLKDEDYQDFAKKHPLYDQDQIDHCTYVDTLRLYDPTVPGKYVDQYEKNSKTQVTKENYYQLDVRQREPNTGFRIARTLPKV